MIPYIYSIQLNLDRCVKILHVSTQRFKLNIDVLYRKHLHATLLDDKLFSHHPIYQGYLLQTIVGTLIVAW